MGTNSGRALSGQALVSDQAASRLAPAGFDPSRLLEFISERYAYHKAERREALAAEDDYGQAAATAAMLELLEIKSFLASGIAARSDETAQQAQP